MSGNAPAPAGGLKFSGSLPITRMQAAAGRLFSFSNEVAVMFRMNAASAELAAAASSGRNYRTAFISTWTMMARMSDVVITSDASADGGGEMTTLELNFRSVNYEPVK